MFDWTNYSNLTRLQINVDTILFSNGNLIRSLIQPTLWLVWHAHMHNSLTHRSRSPSPRGGELPYMGYIGLCGPEEYGFSTVLVIDRVSILADFRHFGHK